jgi:hypothetical protein
MCCAESETISPRMSVFQASSVMNRDDIAGLAAVGVVRIG